MLNVVAIAGRLTRDPELRTTNSGTSVVSFSIAVDRNYTAQGAEREADFLDVVAWKGTADFICKYFGKGSAIIVEGRLQTRNWEDKSGNKRKSTEIVAENVYFGDSKKKSEDNANEDSYNYSIDASGDLQSGFSQIDDDSELPF